MNPENLCAKTEAFHDGELSPTEARAIIAHIGGCPSCREKLTHLRALEMILRPHVPAGDISAAVMSRLAALDTVDTRQASVFAGWWKVPALALASCAVYALCVETGVLPANRSQLLTAMAAHKEAERFSTMIFGGREASSEQLLTMLLEGEGK
jgi:anti-sigma factor RsiW